MKRYAMQRTTLAAFLIALLGRKKFRFNLSPAEAAAASANFRCPTLARARMAVARVASACIVRCLTGHHGRHKSAVVTRRRLCD